MMHLLRSGLRKGAKSLNECLHRDPINLLDMCGILLRFCTYFWQILKRLFFK